MGPTDRNDRQRIRDVLAAFHSGTTPLPGVVAASRRDVYVDQLLESIRRVRYINVIRRRHIDPLRADPASDLFDPHKGAAYLASQGRVDEAFWQIFLSVHFGRNRRHGWRCARAIYTGLGTARWDWDRISTNPQAFRHWLASNQPAFVKGGPHQGFGNHRKYQSLSATSPTGTGAAFESYVNWVGASRSHEHRMQNARDTAGADPRMLFAHLFDSLSSVASFGRTAKFDYLTMLGKLQLVNISPNQPYLQGATGPLRGARLMFLGNQTSQGLSVLQLDHLVVQLGSALNVGMQEMEDSLCNWQKSPDVFDPYRG